MARNLLETNGITACVADEQAASMFGTFCMGGAKLMVAEPDAVRAEAILASVHEEPELEEEEAKPVSEGFATTRTCPKCGQSFDVGYTRCPDCAPSEEITEGEPINSRVNLAPLGPEDELKDAPYSQGDEFASRALLIAFVMIFLGGGPPILFLMYAQTVASLFGPLSLPSVIGAVFLALLFLLAPHLYVFFLVYRFFFYEGESRKSSELKAIAAVLISGGILCLLALSVVSHLD
jgi:hypothetical protein